MLSVVDADEAEPRCRGCWSGRLAPPAVEKRVKVGRCQTTCTYLHERAHDSAHHVAEEPRPRHLVHQQRAAGQGNVDRTVAAGRTTLEDRSQNRAYGRVDVRSGAEGREVVRALD